MAGEDLVWFTVLNHTTLEERRQQEPGFLRGDHPVLEWPGNKLGTSERDWIAEITAGTRPRPFIFIALVGASAPTPKFLAVGIFARVCQGCSPNLQHIWGADTDECSMECSLTLTLANVQLIPETSNLYNLDRLRAECIRRGHGWERNVENSFQMSLKLLPVTLIRAASATVRKPRSGADSNANKGFVIWTRLLQELRDNPLQNSGPIIGDLAGPVPQLAETLWTPPYPDGIDSNLVGQWGERYAASTILPGLYPTHVIIWMNQAGESRSPFDFVLVPTIPEGQSIFVEVKTSYIRGNTSFFWSRREFEYSLALGNRYRLLHVSGFEVPNPIIRHILNPSAGLRERQLVLDKILATISPTVQPIA